MAQFVAEYKITGDTLSLTVKNKRLESAEVEKFLSKAIADASVWENVDFLVLRKVKPKPEPKKPEVKK